MDEKMMILKMLQDGKITSEEAYKLINAIDGSKSEETRNTSRKIEIDVEDKLNRFAEKASRIAEKVNQKANKFAEKVNQNINSNPEIFNDDFGKRLESVGNDIAESAVKFADRLVNYLGSVLDFNPDKMQQHKSYTYPAEGLTDLYLSTDNFSVKVNPAETHEIIINMYTNSINPNHNFDEYYSADINGNSCRISTKFPLGTWGRVELLVPKCIDILTVYTSNGKCEINGLNVDQAKYQTSNGKITLVASGGKKIEAITSNGKIVFDNTSFSNTSISTSNGKIEVLNSRFDTIDAKTSNGALLLSGVKTLEAAEAKYNLYTSNGRIAIELEPKPECGYLVDANTSLGSIHVDLPELAYSVEKNVSTLHSTALVKSGDFESTNNKVYVSATTSNASISIEGRK